MKHNLAISVSKKLKPSGIVACRTVTIREKLMKLFLGDLQKVTILVPGDSVNEVAIKETDGGGDNVDLE